MPHPKMQSLSTARKVRMALVAASGFGKTVFAGTAPNALFLTTDPEGTASASAFGSDAVEWPVTSLADLDEAWEYLAGGGVEEDGLEWLIVDDLTNVQRYYMDYGMQTAVELTKDRTNPQNPYVPSQREYLIEQNGLLNFVRRINNLPVNIIYCVHRVGMEDGDANEYYSAAIRGKAGEIAQVVLGWTNIIGMGEVLTIDDEIVRRIYFDHVRSYRGKDRFNRLGKFRDNLTVPEMMEIIRSQEGGPEAPRRRRRR